MPGLLQPARLISVLVALVVFSSACSGSDGSAGADPETDEQASTDSSDSGESATDETEGPTTDEEPEEPAAPEGPPPEWAATELQLDLIAEFTEPVAFSARPGTFDLYVAERAGVIRLVERRISIEGVERISLSNRPVLDITELVSTDGEGGLLGLTFSTDGRFLFINYTDTAGDTAVVEYNIERSTTADVDSRRELVRVAQPFSNHNGGHLAMGPDGYLYIGMGDGGSSNDPEGNGQDPTTLLGSMLRIDPFPNGDQPYSIPSGNPYIDGGGLPEVWLWGLRNPWRYSFDSQTGDLWIGDVGQDAAEEITVLREGADDGGRGANLGWGSMEGNEPVDGASEPDDHFGPIYTYPHEGNVCSVTGGYVYRGPKLPALDGVYIFGDYCTGEINGLTISDEGAPIVAPLSVAAAGGQLVSFGQGPEGEIYVLQDGGQLLRLAALVPQAEG